MFAVNQSRCPQLGPGTSPTGADGSTTTLEPHTGHRFGVPREYALECPCELEFQGCLQLLPEPAQAQGQDDRAAAREADHLGNQIDKIGVAQDDAAQDLHEIRGRDRER